MPEQAVLNFMANRQVGQMTNIQHDACRSELRNINGYMCTIYNYSDPNYTAKSNGISLGIMKLLAKNYRIPSMKFVLSNRGAKPEPGVQKAPTEAYARNKQGNIEITVFLGPNAYYDGGDLGGPLGIAHKIYKKDKTQYSTAVVVHEIGHVFHDILSPDYFWSAEAGGIVKGHVDMVAKYLSPYAATNPKEVVAETFCAHYMDFKFDRAKIMPLYTQFKGPPLR